MTSSLLNEWTNYGPLTSIFTPPPACNYLTISYVTPVPITTTETIYFPTPTTLPHLIIYDPFIAPTCFPSQYPEPSSQTTISTTTTSSFTRVATTTNTNPIPTLGYFSPGRCPEGWATRTLSYSFIPANNTLAACCPTFPSVTPASSSGIQKRRGSKPKKRNLTGCLFALPTPAITSPLSIPTGDSASLYASITAFANGSLTTMAPQDWFEIGGSISGKTVWATGINVMWKRGDFPDIDKTADASSASASALHSHAASSSLNDPLHNGLPLGAKIAIGTIIPMLFILLSVFLFIFLQARMHARGDSVTAAWGRRFKRTSGAEGERRRAENVFFMRGEKAAGAKRSKRATTRGGPASSGARGEDDVENAPNQPLVSEEQPPPNGHDIPPPAYDQSGGPSSTTATGGTSNTRMWNETNLEYDQRRLRERREVLMERIRIGREEDELRARMRNEAP